MSKRGRPFKAHAPPTAAEWLLVRQLEAGRLIEEANREEKQYAARIKPFLAAQKEYAEWLVKEKAARKEAKRTGVHREPISKKAPKRPRIAAPLDQWNYLSAPAQHGLHSPDGEELTGVQEWLLVRVVRGWDPSKGTLEARLGHRFPELKKLVKERSRREVSSATPEERPALAGEGNSATVRAKIKGDTATGGKSAIGSELREGFAVPSPLPDRDRKPGKGRPRKVRPSEWQRNQAGSLWRPLDALQPVGAKLDARSGELDLSGVECDPLTGRAKLSIGSSVDDPEHKAAVKRTDPAGANSLRPRPEGFGDPLKVLMRGESTGRYRDLRKGIDALGNLEPWLEELPKLAAKHRQGSRGRNRGWRTQAGKRQLLEALKPLLPAELAAAVARFTEDDK